MANDVKLQEGHPLDSNLRPLKVGGKSSSIELSQQDNGSGARVTGDLKVTGDIYGDTKTSSQFTIQGDFKTKLTGTVTVVQSSTTVEGTNTLFTTELAVGDAIRIFRVDDSHGHLGGTEIFTVSSITDADTLVLDSAYAGENESGLTAYTDSNLLVVKNGDGVDKVAINKTGNIGIGVTDPDAQLEVNGDIHVENTVYFTAETVNTIADGATGAIDWNVSQKQKLTITGTGITVNFTDPAGVCNLLLRVSQGDGSDVIGTWDSDIKWAGGSAPTLSTGSGEIDILSFYWDGSKYYGVASLDFS